MRFRRLIFEVITFLAATFAATGSAAERPNILFIFTDDQSHRTVGCYPESYDWVRTPNIDALAENGVRFAHCTMGTWCMASRATLLTGHHAYGIESMRMEGEYPRAVYDPEQCPFWPRVFREHGYQTAQIGKWHTGIDNGFGRDWDYQLVWNRPRFPENAGNYFDNQLIQENSRTDAEMVTGYTTDNYTDWALEYIRGEKGRDPDKPWYLWLCFGAVHGPFTPAERHFETYQGIEATVPADIYPPREGKPTYSRNFEQWIPDPESGLPVMKSGQFAGRTVQGKAIHGNTLHDLVRQYHQGVLAIDEGVGKLVAALKETGQDDNTLIVFAADQGIAWGHHGFQIKLAPYDATIRGPLIVSMPGRFASGTVVEKPVGGVDLAPTFFSVAGLDLPWKMHGHDLSPLLENPEAAWDHTRLVVHTAAEFGSETDVIPDMKDDNLFKTSGVPWWVSVRSDRYKYIRTLMPNEPEELYDLQNDPEELVNLATNEEFREILETHRQLLDAELRRTDCGFVDGMPPVASLE